MKTRLLGASAALLLAIVGTLMLVGYVNGAEQRAFDGVETTEVLVVTAAVPAGTPAETALVSATAQDLPRKVVAEDALSDPAVVGGLVTAVDLVPGEQLLISRFVDPAQSVDRSGVEVPDGLQEVTILLEPQRVVGGVLRPGDTVGVFVSLPPEASPTGTPATHLILHKVLVTAIPGLPSEGSGTGETGEPEEAAGMEASGLVTLAVIAADAEKIVFGQEFGTVWLSKEPATAKEEGTRVLTPEGIYR